MHRVVILCIMHNRTPLSSAVYNAESVAISLSVSAHEKTSCDRKKPRNSFFSERPAEENKQSALWKRSERQREKQLLRSHQVFLVVVRIVGRSRQHMALLEHPPVRNWVAQR